MSTLPYPKEQQIHSLSLLSNAAFDLQEPDFTTLQTITTKIIKQTLSNPSVQKTIGHDWQLLWGPVVYSHMPLP